MGLAQATFRTWVRRDPALQIAWKGIREEHAHSLFDRLDEVTHTLAAGKFDRDDNATVTALRAAQDGLKHMTARLLPAMYGEQKAGAQGVTVVINTTLPMDEAPKVVEGEFKVALPLPGPGND